MMGLLKKWLVLSMILTLVLAVPAAAQEEAPTKSFFTLHMVYRSDDPTDAAIANIAKEELAKIGINLELHSYEWGTLLDRVFFEGAQKTFDEDGWDLHIVYWIYGVADVNPRSVWHSTALSPNGYQPYGYNNGTVDLAIQKGEETWDSETRGEYYREMQQQIFEDQPYAFLYIPKFAYLLDPAIQNFEPVESIRRLEDVTVDGKTPTDSVELVFQMSADVKNIGPVLPKDTWTLIVSEALYTPLITLGYDDSGGVVFKPGLASSWDIAEDGKKMVFNLRDDMVFSDGQPVTCRDIKMTIDAHRTKETGSVRYNVVSTALGDIQDTPDAVMCTDDYTLTLNFQQVYAPFLSTLADAGEFGAAPYHILNDVPRADWITHWMNTGADGQFPVGSGAYMITDWVKDEYITIEPNPYYAGEQPFVDKWTFRIIPERSTAVAAIENDEVDVVHYQSVPPADVERLQGSGDVRVLTYLHPGFNGIGFNLFHPVLANKYVRWAISYAMPRQHIIDNVLKGMGAPGAGPVPIQVKWAYNKDYNSSKIEYSIEKAREYMEKAGYRFEYLEEPETQAAQTGWVAPFFGGLVIGGVITYLISRRRT